MSQVMRWKWRSYGNSDSLPWTHPLGFKRIEPQALLVQKQWENAHAIGWEFEVLIAFLKPRAHELDFHARMHYPR